jgi:dTDP-4-amino-4,6-dideoxygalactose transaminase
MKIPFNKPYYPPESMLTFIRTARSGGMAGNGVYSKKCHRFFEERYGFAKVLLTTSCTDALEMTAILAGIEPGNEVIMPSFTFVSTANAFLLRGAKLVFADILPGIPNIDPEEIRKLISPKTKAIVVVHYCGISCDMDAIMDIAKQHGLIVIEDAAHATDSYYKGKPLGSIGHFGTFSFHETKNIFCGEGGLLCINDPAFVKRAEIIWEKGTNRAAFYRGEVDKYNWVDVGSSFLMSDALASFLLVQLKNLDKIQKRRIENWRRYRQLLAPLEEQGKLKLPEIPEYATVNGNMFYFLVKDEGERDRLIDHLRSKGIQAVFHYLPLHSSPFFSGKHDGRPLPNTTKTSSCIVRLPFFYSLTKGQIRYIAEAVTAFFEGKS